MKGQLIKNYINKLTKQDINSLAIQHNVNLTDQELNYLYNQIKNHYNDLLYGDTEYLFNDLKKNVTDNNYFKIKELYTTYKNKFQSFL
ncbi:MAG: DUF2624 family protein [Bacilli bacterium]|nr:DUF2624 family protein [Bacilli bacterium]